MASKTIKISGENYFWLLKLAGELQKQRRKPVSFDEAIYVLRSNNLKKKKLSSLAGSWKMSDKEAEDFKKNLRKGRSKWEIPSV